MKSVFSIFTVAVCLLLASCGSSTTDCGSEGFAQVFQNELSKITEASTDFSNDPTNSDKCEAFKGAYIDYIDALEDWEDCAKELSQEEGWRASLDQSRQAIDDIEC